MGSEEEIGVQTTCCILCLIPLFFFLRELYVDCFLFLQNQKRSNKKVGDLDDNKKFCKKENKKKKKTTFNNKNPISGNNLAIPQMHIFHHYFLLDFDKKEMWYVHTNGLKKNTTKKNENRVCKSTYCVKKSSLPFFFFCTVIPFAGFTTYLPFPFIFILFL